MHVAPEASVDDGLLDVVVVGGLSRPALLAKLPKLYAGTHLRDPAVRLLRGKLIEADAPDARVPLELDGEPLGSCRRASRCCRARCASSRRLRERRLRAHPHGGSAASRARARHVRIDATALAALAERDRARGRRPRCAADPAHRAFSDADAHARLRAHARRDQLRLGLVPAAAQARRPLRLLHHRDGAGASISRRTAPWDARRAPAPDARRRARASSASRDGRGDRRADGALRARAERPRALPRRRASRAASPALVRSAAGRAAALVEQLAADALLSRRRRATRVARCRFYKRAQISVSDLANAFGGEGSGRFEDRERLTIFADNLVPHVLRLEGVLVYDAALLARIEAGSEIASGSARGGRDPRAGAARRRAAAWRGCARSAWTTSAEQLDHWLWNRGQRPEIKAHPRHRTRSVYY